MRKLETMYITNLMKSQSKLTAFAGLGLALLAFGLFTKYSSITVRWFAEILDKAGTMMKDLGLRTLTGSVKEMTRR